MQLKTYMEKNKWTVLGFAKALGVARYTLQRYLHQGRLPPPKVLEKLHALTNGAVSPNDFYDLAPKKKAKAKKAKH